MTSILSVFGLPQAFIDALNDNFQALTDAVNEILAGGAGLPEATIVTEAFTAEAGQFYGCDTTEGTFLATLDPAAPIGSTVTFEDPYDTWKVNALTITAGEVTIDGETEHTCDTAERFTLIRLAEGWRTKESTILFPMAE